MQSQERLVAVFDLVTSVGGVQNVMVDLLPRLSERFRVAVLDAYLHPAYTKLLSELPVEQVTLGSAPERRFIGGEGPAERFRNLTERAPWLILTGLRLRQWVKDRRPAVIYFNQLPSLLLFSRFVPVCGPGIVYHAHGFARPGEVHGGPYITRRCSSIFAVSGAVAAVMSEAGVHRSKVTVVHNGVDADDLRRRARSSSVPLPPRAPGDVVVVHVAILAPNKQQHIAIEALAHLPSHVVLWLCGDVMEGGDRLYADGLRSLVNRLGLGARVKFLGWREDVPSVLAAADVAILPSLQEGLGRVLLEAMALGRPCIGTAVGGIPEVIEHGVTGWVTGTGPQDLAAALGKLVTSAEARRAMGEAGRRRVERSFAVARQAGTVGGLLDAAAKDSWSRPGVTWWQSLRP